MLQGVDSNHRHTEYESVELPTALPHNMSYLQDSDLRVFKEPDYKSGGVDQLSQSSIAPRNRFELLTIALTGRCSTVELSGIVLSQGLEPQ